MSKLSQAQKYAVQGALHDGKSPTEIAKMIKSTIPVVERYIDGELSKLHETIAKTQVTTEYEPPVKVKGEFDPPQKQPDVQEIKKLPKGYGKSQFAFKKKEDKTSMNDGYAIMTPNASSAGDDFIKQMPRSISRTAKNNLFRADTGEKIDG